MKLSYMVATRCGRPSSAMPLPPIAVARGAVGGGDCSRRYGESPNHRLEGIEDELSREHFAGRV